MDQVFEATEIQAMLKAFTGIRRVCPGNVMFIFWIQQPWKHLAVVDFGRRNSISANEPMVDIDANAVLGAVVIDSVFPGPGSV